MQFLNHYFGKLSIVKAKIASTRLFDKENKKLLLINLDKPYPETALTIVIYDEVYKKLDLVEDIEGKVLIIKGIITIFKEKPQIVISDLKNFSILE